MENFEINAFKNRELISAEEEQNAVELAYVKRYPLDLGDLGFKNLSMSRYLREQKEKATARAQKLNLSPNQQPQVQRRSMQYMKRFDKSGQRRILNKSMTHKVRENRYYNQLETQIEALAD